MKRGVEVEDGQVVVIWNSSKVECLYRRDSPLTIYVNSRAPPMPSVPTSFTAPDVQSRCDKRRLQSANEPHGKSAVASGCTCALYLRTRCSPLLFLSFLSLQILSSSVRVRFVLKIPASSRKAGLLPAAYFVSIQSSALAGLLFNVLGSHRSRRLNLLSLRYLFKLFCVTSQSCPPEALPVMLCCGRSWMASKHCVRRTPCSRLPLIRSMGGSTCWLASSN